MAVGTRENGVERARGDSIVRTLFSILRALWLYGDCSDLQLAVQPVSSRNGILIELHSGAAAVDA